jgi:GDPmannose 4,6-dehydratase
MKTALITGITGQDGPYLAKLLIDKGYNVVGTTRSYNTFNFFSFDYLKIKDKVKVEECDLTDVFSILKLLNKYHPDEIYNLAAQSSVGLSFEQPIGTIQFNTNSVLNLLEAIRLVNPKIKFYQASSSEMYGKVENLPIRENTPLHPLSPYAISKASSYWTVVNYRESYGLFACNGVLFNHESFLRGKNFFVKKVLSDSVKISRGELKELRVGNVEIKRDFGFTPMYVKAMWMLLQNDTPIDVLICSGKSVKLRDIIIHIFNKLEIPLEKLIIDPLLFRPVDITDSYGDNSKAKDILGWDYETDFFDVLNILLKEELNH